MTKETSNLSFKDINKRVKDDFDKLVEESSLSRHDFLDKIIKSYKSIFLDFTNEEAKILNQARSLMPVTYSQTLKARVLSAANSIIRSTQSDTGINTDHKNSRISADRRADIAFKEIINKNNKAKEWYEKIFITNSSFIKLASNKKSNGSVKTSFSKQTTDRCLERNRILLKEHNEKHNLDEEHNLKAYYYRLKIKKLESKK